MSSPADAYFTLATSMLEQAKTANADVLKTAGALVGQSIADGGVLHTFGRSSS
mgnify:CR=1 FL=1